MTERYEQRIEAGAAGAQGPNAIAVVNNYYGSTHAYSLVEPPLRESPEISVLRDQPSRLLDARNRVVPFIGRQSEFERLTNWRDSSAQVACMLSYAEGGQGKTRLAIEFAEKSRTVGWHVLHAIHAVPPVPAEKPHGAVAASRAGLLLVVDYADRWPYLDLRRLLADSRLRQGVPLRLLLLARSVGTLGVGWWPAIKAELSELGIHTVDDLRLGELAPSIRDRQAAFIAARNRFCGEDLYTVRDPEAVPVPEALNNQEYGAALTLHMAALVAVDAHVRRDKRPPTEPHQLSAYLLDREYMAWHRHYTAGAARGKEYSTPPSVMGKAVFTATLTGAVTYDAGKQLVGSFRLETPPDRILTDHGTCYPPENPITVLQPLYPDRLAEDFLGLLYPGHQVSGYPSDPWTVTVPAKLLARHDGTAPPFVSRAIAFLAAAADRWPHLARDCLYPLLQADPQLALDAGGGALSTIAAIGARLDSSRIDPGLLATLEAIEFLLPERDAALDAGIADMTGRLTSHRVADVCCDAHHALLHMKHAHRLGNAGCYEEALQPSLEAVTIYRHLASEDPATFAIDLAAALNNLANRQSDLGHEGEAITAAREATALFRRHGDQLNPDQMAGSATVLDTLTGRLGELGEYDEALLASAEALAIRRDLAGKDPAAYRPGLASSLNNHGIILGNLGRHEEALASVEESLVIYRELAKPGGPAYEQQLATVLDNVAGRRMAAGNKEEALAAAREAEEIWRTLAQINPAAHTVSLAMCLYNLGIRLASVNLKEEAFASAEEAVAIFEPIAQSFSARSRLAVFLEGMADRLLEIGRQADSTDARHKAATIKQQLTAGDPLSHLRKVAIQQASDSCRRLRGSRRLVAISVAGGAGTSGVAGWCRAR